MAIFDNSPFTPNIKGKIGGTSFSNSIAGRTMKNGGRRSIGLSYQSSQAKLLLNKISSMWINLTDAERQEWSLMANYKPTSQKRNIGKFINGQQFYIKFQSAHFNQFSSFFGSPILTPYAFTQLTPSLTNVAGTLTLNVTNNINETDEFVIFKISAPVNGSKNSPRGGVKMVRLSFANTSSCDISFLYTSLFGMLPPVGSYVFCEFQSFATQVTDFTSVQKYKLIVN